MLFGLSSGFDFTECFRSTPTHLSSEFLWLIKTYAYSFFFLLHKGKDSTSDLDREIDFQEKMMNLSSGSGGM